MTRQDYILLAAGFKEALEAWPDEADFQQRVGVQTAANRVSRRLAADNPAFDRNRFLAACGL